MSLGALRKLKTVDEVLKAVYDPADLMGLPQPGEEWPL